MSGDPEPVVRDSGEVEYEEVDAAEGLSKGVLINDEHGAPNFAIRRFVLESGGEVPKHTNKVEHEQYVIAGEYTVGIEDEQYTVSTGDSLLIPAGVVHWYANDSDEMGEFICVVPNGDDNINLIE